MPTFERLMIAECQTKRAYNENKCNKANCFFVTTVFKLTTGVCRGIHHSRVGVL